MNIYYHRLAKLPIPLLFALALCLFLWQAVGTSFAEPPIYGFVSLAGHDGQIDQAAAPFVADGRLHFVREYGAAASNYHVENPNYNGGQLPNPFNIKVYQVMTTTPNVNTIINAVYAEAATYADVQAERDIQHLAYIPQQIIVSGTCADVASTVNRVDLTPVQGVEAVEFTIQGDCFAVGLFQSLAGKTVVQTINSVNMVIDNDPNIDDALAQPNQLTMGFPGGYYIFGSPAGMATPGTTTLTLPNSPFDGFTGQKVGIAIFDTSPYVAAPAVSTQNVNGIDITVNKSLPLPPGLPFSGQSVVGSHGTFVATPITHYAPSSDIYLMRALSIDGIGTEFLLIQAIEEMRNFFLTNADNYDGVIFNYSLGLEEEDYVDSLSALARTLDQVHNTNIFQIGAAGNNSAWSLAPRDPNLPASHPNVLGVTAIAPGNTLACYANKGDIATWGGGDPRSAPGPCLPDKIAHDCAINVRGGCLTGFDPHSPNDWAYGIGTSFAAPIITGMAAQKIEELGPSRSEFWQSPTAVRAQVEEAATPDDADMGSGFIGDYTVPTSVGLSGLKQANVQAVWLSLLTIIVITLTTGLAFSRKVEKIERK